jgi:hypothetical protein
MMPLQQLVEDNAVEEGAKAKSEKDACGCGKAGWSAV